MTAATQISRSAVSAYSYLTPTVPEMQALGIHSPIIINDQLVINDRLRPDRYWVKSITGLRGPDIRDNRVVHPSDHGEIPYDSFWGGSTLTFQGTMEAGNIAELDRLESDLIAATGSLTEIPYKFNWWDQRDNFNDPQSAAFWGVLSGSPLLIPGNGRATTSGGGASIAYHNLRGGFVDEIVTAQVSITPMSPANNIGVICACTSSTSYLMALISWNGTSSMSVNLFAVQPSGTTTLATASMTVPTGAARFWIQLQTIGEAVSASVYSANPTINPNATPAVTCSTTLVGAMAETFGYQQPGFVGLVATSTANWAFLDWRVDAIWPCDFVINAKPIQSPAIAHTAQMSGTRAKRDFQFAVRASDPRILCPTAITANTPLATTPQVAFGRVYPRTYPRTYPVALSEPAGTLLAQTSPSTLEVVANNHGSWIAKPVITINGGITNPVLANLTTGANLVLNGTIAAGDFIVVDCLNKTLVNSAGSDVFGIFDPSSSWLTLVPGNNVFQLVGSQPVGSPSATISWKHAWK